MTSNDDLATWARLLGPDVLDALDRAELADEPRQWSADRLAALLSRRRQVVSANGEGSP